MKEKSTTLVIGGAGYIGSAIVKQLVASGKDVIVFDDLSSGQKDLVDAQVLFVEGDVLDQVALDQLFSGHDIGAVVHCAAKKVVAEGETDPSLYYRNNVCGTLNILEAMSKHEVSRIVFSSSAAVYAPSDIQEPITESAAVDPISVYGRSKMFAEELIADFARLGKIGSYANLRYFNVAGDAGLDFKEANAQNLFPLVAMAATGDEVFRVTGTDYETRDGSAVRDYIHLEDLVTAHVCALMSTESGAFNLGTSTGYTVREVVAMFSKLLGRDFAVEDAPRRPGDLGFVVADSTRAREVLGWTPEKTLEDMVASTITVYGL